MRPAKRNPVDAPSEGHTSLFSALKGEHPSGTSPPHRGERARGERAPIESTILDRIRAELATYPDVRVWRNSTGVGTTAWGSGIRFGLGKGGADLVGIGPGGKFLGLEVKRPTTRGRSSPDQKRWRDTVRRFGGVAEVVTSPEEARALVESMREVR